MDEEQPQDVVEQEEQVDAQVEDQIVAEPDADVEAPVEDEPAADPEPEAPVEAPVEAEPEQKEPVQEEPEQEAAEEYSGDLPKDIGSGCESLYADNPPFNWMITKLTDAQKGKDALIVDSVGKGGLNELTEILKTRKSDILFFCLRVDTFDDEGSSRAKFIYGRYMGSGVAFMQKAKVSVQLGGIADMFPVKHLSKDADESMKAWDVETLGKEFLRIGGAHKPSRYDFGPNAVYNCPK